MYVPLRTDTIRRTSGTCGMRRQCRQQTAYIGIIIQSRYMRSIVDIGNRVRGTGGRGFIIVRDCYISSSRHRNNDDYNTLS